MELLVKLLIGIAWPVSIVWIAYLFKAELRSLLHRVTSLKIKGVEAQFEKELIEAEKSAAVLRIPAGVKHDENAQLTSKLELLRRISDVSPRAAILESWVLVEEAAGKSGFVQGATIPRINPHLYVSELVKLGKLPPASEELVQSLRKLRNEAAHIPEFYITKDEADRYLELAAKISGLLLEPY